MEQKPLPNEWPQHIRKDMETFLHMYPDATPDMIKRHAHAMDELTPDAEKSAQTPLPPLVTDEDLTAACNRIMLRTSKNAETGCWDCNFADRANGYRSVQIRGRGYRAHRVVYECLKGRIPDGLPLDHLCRNRRCVNPDHLEAVPGRINTLRGLGPTAKNARKTHCPNGHSLSEDNLHNNKNGYRVCATCKRRKALAYYHKTKALAKSTLKIEPSKP